VWSSAMIIITSPRSASIDCIRILAAQDTTASVRDARTLRAQRQWPVSYGNGPKRSHTLTGNGADGVFGPKTIARIVEFQEANRLKADGHVGPRTKADVLEVTELTLPVVLMPCLQLTPPKFGQRAGLQPPQLIPPLQWPSAKGRTHVFWNAP
jgi:hypothetical protein